jgi:DNA-binding XRE family transcriptional regulator
MKRVALQACREALGLSQATVARAVGISRSHYCRVERGDRTPHVRWVVALARVLRVTLTRCVRELILMEGKKRARGW